MEYKTDVLHFFLRIVLDTPVLLISNQRIVIVNHPKKILEQVKVRKKKILTIFYVKGPNVHF